MFDLNTLTEIDVIKKNERQRLTLCQNSEGEKFLKREINGDKREIYKSIQMIEHPNIPKIHSVELNDKTVVIEEYIEGISLSDLMNIDEKFTKRNFLSIINQVLSALETLHMNNIIHKDIKPDNILVDSSNHIWLIDYDIARVFREEVRKDTETLGTFGYAPIEQYGMMPTDLKTDIYAVGMTMKTFLDYIGIKGGILKVAEKCTRLDPAQRFKDVKSLRKALKRPKRIFFAVLLSVLLIIIGTLFLIFNFRGNIEKAQKAENETVQITDTVLDNNTETTESLEEDDETIEQSETEQAEVVQNDEPQKQQETIQENKTEKMVGFNDGTVEMKYSKYPKYPSAVIFSVDQPWEHLMFLEDMTKKGIIKLGRENTRVDSEITLNNGVLSVNLDDGKGHKFNKDFKFDGQYTYKKAYDENLRQNADIILRDLDNDGIMELLIGMDEVAIGVIYEQFYVNFNYCIAWCIKYDENAGFTLCNGDMFSEGASFNLNKHTSKLNVRWTDFYDITGYVLLDNDIKPVH